jgi:putative transposase
MGFTPLTAWLAGTTNRAFVLRRPAGPQKLYIDFLPGEKRIIRRDGLQPFGIHYWDNTLSPLAGRSKKDILVRYDPRNLSHVFIKEREGGE